MYKLIFVKPNMPAQKIEILEFDKQSEAIRYVEEHGIFIFRLIIGGEVI